jgi:hypothetical protein
MAAKEAFRRVMPETLARAQAVADALLAVRAQRPLAGAERADLAAALRTLGRDWEASELEAEPLPAPLHEPLLAPSPGPAGDLGPPWQPRRRRGRWAVAALVAACALLGSVAGVAWRSRGPAADDVCRQRLARLGPALASYCSQHGGCYPPPGVDLAAALAPYGVTAEGLRCPLGASYRLNPVLADYPAAAVPDPAQRPAVFEADAVGRPARIHDGLSFVLYVDGHQAAAAPEVVRAALFEPLPPAPAPAAAPAAAPPAATAAPAKPAAPAPKAVAKPTATPAAAPPALPKLAADSAAETPPLPPESKHWLTVLDWRDRGTKLSQAFEIGPQARLTWQTWDAAGGSQPFDLVLQDAASGRDLEILAQQMGLGRGTVELRHEGRVRLAAHSGQRFAVTVEDRR